MSRGLFGILKLFLFSICLPAIIAAVSAFQKEVAIFKDAPDVFFMGIIVYTIFHLFVFKPKGFFDFWQNIFAEICSFAGSGARVIALAVPIVMTLILLIYYISTVIFRQPWAADWLVFLTGIALAFHVIMSGQELYEEDDTSLKGHYFFALGLMVIANIVLAAGLMDLIFKNFAFVDFWHQWVGTAGAAYRQVLGAAGISF